MSPRRHLLLLASVAVLCAWSHGSILGYPGLTGTDTLLLYAQADVASFAELLELLGESTTAGAKGRDSFFYRPVHMAILAAQRAIFDWGPLGHHALALLLHACNAWLAGLVARRGALRLGLRAPDATAFAAAALFLIHPISIEVVPSDARSADLFHTLFLLAALLAADRADLAKGGRGAWGIAAIFAAAIGIKEHGVVITGPVLAWLVLVRSDLEPAQRWRAALRVTLYCVVVAALFVVLRRAALGEWLGGYARPEQWRTPTLLVLKGITFDLLMPRLAADAVAAWPRLGAFWWRDAWLGGALAAGIGALLWLRATPERAPALRWASFAGTALAAYAAFYVIGKVFAPRLVYPLAALAALGLAPALAALGSPAPAHARLPAVAAQRIAVAALALLWLAQSPLLLRDEEWRSSALAMHRLGEDSRELWRSLPGGARVYLVNLPGAFTCDPGRANWAWKTSTTNALFYFSLQAWLDDQLPGKRIRLAQLGVNNYSAPFHSYRHHARVDAGAVSFDLPPTRAPYAARPFPEWIIPGLASQGLDGSERFLALRPAGPGRAALFWTGPQAPPSDHFALIVDAHDPRLVPLAAIHDREKTGP